MLKNIIATVSGLMIGAAMLVGAASADTYQVQAGDTLSEIASVNGTTVEEIASANNIQDVNVIYVGEQFEVGASSNATIPASSYAEPSNTIDVTPNVGTEPAHNAQTPTEQAKTEPPVVTITVKPSVSASTYTGHSAKQQIAQLESSGSYTAVNGQYYGRYQLQIGMLNGDLSPANQEATADRYVAERYGSWEAALAFHNANGWY